MKTKHKKLKMALLILSISIVLVFALFGGSFAIIYNKYTLDVNALTSINNGVKVYSAEGNENTLYNSNRTITDINILPDYVKNAFIDTEDKRFYSHNGYDFKRIVKAGLVNLTNKSKSQGASTISQQLIKNALLTNEKTYNRKIKELVLSMKMEKQFEKNKILEMYLNTIYFGSNSYGIENASNVYFNKSAKDLTLNEACCLAGIIKSPNKYSPITNYNNSVERRNIVAKLMLEQNHITEAEYQEVVSSPIVISKNTELDNAYEKEAIYEACKLLNISERELINKGYQIITFKDNELQNKVKKANNNVIHAAQSQYNTNLDSLSIVIDNEGKVLSYYIDSNYNLHNMKRQPASTLKPLAVYLPCITHNICAPATLILDEKINFNGYSPLNADKQFHGYVSVRESLKDSLNIPAVKLLDSLGVDNARNALSSLDINTTNKDANLSLALGSTEKGVNLLDLTSAYSVLANSGYSHSIRFVDKILDKNDNVIYQSSTYSEKVFNEEDCYLVTDMLKDCAISGTAKRLASLNLPVASKTGTANNGQANTDLYNVSYTTEHTMLSWVSNIATNSLPSQLHSSSEPTEINKQILSSLYENKKPKDFAKPNNVEKLGYDIIEAEDNHRIVTPQTSLDRYIAYDLFKTSNPPTMLEQTNDIVMNVSVSKYGANINFIARRNQEYSIIKIVDNKETIINNVKEQSGEINFLDTDIFNYSKITYCIKSNNLESNKLEIYPKDYLINQLNNELLNNKRKWSV